MDNTLREGYVSGFDELTHESGLVTLPVDGELPAWLEGDLLRNGPAGYSAGPKSFRHWFDGQAMVHRFEIADGGVRYRNRFLDTPAMTAARGGRIGYREFATDPCGSLFGRMFTKFRGRAGANACVNIVPSDDGPLALTETPIAVRFDQRTLDTVGVVRHPPGLDGRVTTAHPQQAPGSGDLVNYLLRFGRTSEYQVFRQTAADAPAELLASIPYREPGYLHSFAITERYVVLAVFPFVVNPLALLLRDRPFIANYRWRPELGTKYVVVRLADGEVVATVTGDPLFAFHHINAFDDGDELVVDMSAYDDADVIDAFHLDKLRSRAPMPLPYPTRCRIDIAAGTVSRRRLSDEALELPRIASRTHNGRPYRYAYGVGSSDRRDFFNQLVKVDVTTGRADVWQRPGIYPGEPVFVPAPGGAAEDDGVLLSVVLDPARERSSLLVLDATSLEEVARADVPHAIPFGFHGQFIRT